jgi:soluble lytic murein transglycosylase-like protein
MRCPSPACHLQEPKRVGTTFVRASVRGEVRTRILSAALGAAVLAACGGGAATPSGSEVASAPSPAKPSVRFTPIPTVAPTPKPTDPNATPIPSPTAPPDWNSVPNIIEEPRALAQQLVTAERAIRDPSVTGAQLMYWSHLEQLAVSEINDNYATWKDQVLALVPDELRKTVAGTIEAGHALRNLKGPTPKTLPDWQIVDPAPLDDLLRFYKEGEVKYGVPWYYLASINLIETRMGRIRGVSYAGAQGPMQFMPATWSAYGKGDVNDPHDAILGAANYLKANGAPTDMQRSLYAYNHAQAYVDAITGYALVMKDDPTAFRGYWGWQVYYSTVDGTSWLKVGWKKE